MTDKDLAIAFQGIFKKCTTSPDGWDITFSVSEQEAAQVMQVASFRDMVLRVAVVPAEENY